MADTAVQAAAPRYVDWGVVFAGTVVASAISFVLTSAGASVGLSMISAETPSTHGKLAATLAAFWVLVVPILSFLIGGYIAGRMRARLDIDPEEAEFRDGVHGLLVWGMSVLFGAVVAASAVTGAARIGGEVGKTAVASGSNIVAPMADTLLRPGPNAERQSQAQDTSTRDAITRVLASAVTGQQPSASDRAYLNQVVAQRTGLPTPEVEKRVNEAYANAAEALRKARNAAVAAGLALATALLFGLAAAWYAAQHGGRHRDEKIPARFNFARPKLPM